MNWNPYSVHELKVELQGIPNWFLDGGYSLELFLGKSTREHGDIDIGVFTQNAKTLLDDLTGRNYQIYIASKGELRPYSAVGFNESNYNYWVSDGEAYRFQILTYALSSGQVSFRRNKGIYWPEDIFTLEKDGISFVNPLVTYAFKVTTGEIEEKDLADISSLTAWVAKNS